MTIAALWDRRTREGLQDIKVGSSRARSQPGSQIDGCVAVPKSRYITGNLLGPGLTPHLLLLLQTYSLPSSIRTKIRQTDPSPLKTQTSYPTCLERFSFRLEGDVTVIRTELVLAQSACRLYQAARREGRREVATSHSGTLPVMARTASRILDRHRERRRPHPPIISFAKATRLLLRRARGRLRQVYERRNLASRSSR